ncbi:hypothetical protein B0T24DRAFT_589550 [Lasiosphaeria ovina]|uniref:Uncharacterized protein n=1 Tax=Lasiosphaeria ovina TaxID=92902 RepID=A0AAE0ND21_9PEZI|nr:hypothetical protein B0T24DRAFT_589550 [Lasiosphaeria ovina]
MCENADAGNGPFCSPKDGAQIQVGKTIDVIWNPAFFNSSFNNVAMIQVQADFLTRPDDGNKGGADGFTSRMLDASSGRFAWTVLAEYLGSTRAGAARPAQLFISQPAINVANTGGDGDGNDDSGRNGDGGMPMDGSSQTRIPGPRVQLIGPSSGGGGSMLNPLIIALPIALGVLALGLLVAFLVFRRRNPGRMGQLFSCGRKRDGYGERKSRTQRLRGLEIRMVDNNASTRMGTIPALGNADRNIFREEVRRQDYVRR